MPREHRKRGKKHKKHIEEKQEPTVDEGYGDQEQESQAGPSWIVEGEQQNAVNPEAPFGYVDPDVKAYFRTVDEKLREWQESRGHDRGGREAEDVDPNEERLLFLIAALSELSGKEKQLATDPDCSTMLERMLHSMDDFVKRVFLDRLAGSTQQLSQHRFASHVVQTMLTISEWTLHREAKGIIAPAPDSNESEGKLPTLTLLLIDLCEELLPATSALLMDPFASHVLRALFILICPALAHSSRAFDSDQVLRSKKSAKYKAKQGPMKSVFDTAANREDSTAVDVDEVLVPAELKKMAGKFVKAVRDALSENEVRALAADKVACPVLALLLEMENLQGEGNTPGSLMDSVSCGLVTACLQNPPAKSEPSDYVATLLRDPTSSHLLETLVAASPDGAFEVMWELYFKGKLSKLAVHPVANFVVARVIGRLDSSRLMDVVSELEGSWSKIIKNARTGVLRATVDRSASLGDVAKNVCEAMATAFGISISDDKSQLVPCVLHLKLLDEYKELAAHAKDAADTETRSMLEPTTQGSLLLQSLLKLPDPYNQLIVDSLLSQSVDENLSMSRNPTSSRILDMFLSSPTVPARSKRKFLTSLIGHYHTLVDDRIGSRVGDRCWAAADPYLKEKIARSLFVHEQTLAASYFGRFFAKNLNLYLLKKDPEKWKEAQVQAAKVGKDVTRKEIGTNSAASQPKGSPAQTNDALEQHEPKPKKRKREAKAADEIDSVFASALGKKAKKGSLAQSSPLATTKTPVVQSDTSIPIKSKEKLKPRDKDLDVVLGAIRSAPKDLNGGRKKR